MRMYPLHRCRAARLFQSGGEGAVSVDAKRKFDTYVGQGTLLNSECRAGCPLTAFALTGARADYSNIFSLWVPLSVAILIYMCGLEDHPHETNGVPRKGAVR